MLVILLTLNNNLGGSSKDLAHLGLELDSVVVFVHGLGLPGASSHWNGTEAWIRGGGVNVPVGSGGLLGNEKRESLGVEFASQSASDPIDFLSSSMSKALSFV